MIDQRLPFAEIEVPCSTCGRMVLQAKRRAGRHSRFCSDKCKRVAQITWSRRWRAKHPDYNRLYYERSREGWGGQIPGEVEGAQPHGAHSQVFFSSPTNSAAPTVASPIENPGNGGFVAHEAGKSTQYFASEAKDP